MNSHEPVLPPREVRRLAFFAVGGMAQHHLRHMARRPGVQIVAMADLRPEALEEARAILAETHSEADLAVVAESTDALALAETVECDAAFLAIPNPARMPVVRRLLERGIPVLAEKPAAHSLEDFDGLLALRRKTGAQLMISQNYRFNPAARLIRRLLRAGEIGDVETVQGRFVRNHRYASTLYYGKLPGAVPFRIEMVIHHLDVAASWIGSEPVRVVGDGYRTPTSWGVGQTGCDVLARFANGARLNYHGDWSASATETGWEGHWTLTGSRGVITWRDGVVRLTRAHDDPFKGEGGEVIDYRPAEMADALVQIHDEFFAALREGREPESGIVENAASFRLCLQAAGQDALGV